LGGILIQIPKDLWNYNRSNNILTLNGVYCDLRSADKPENIEGFGYKLIILNEAGIILKNERLWNESIRPMVLDYKADVLIGGTPKGKKTKNGEEHLFYTLYKKGKNNKEEGEKSNWMSFDFKTYDNPLLDIEEIDELASDISPVLRDQEIFGMFVDKETHSIVKREWWGYYRGTEYLSEHKRGIIQSWDTAFKKNEENDFSVCTTWIITNRAYYLIDLFRDRIEFPDLKRKVKELYDKYLPNSVWIEDKASGQSLIQELQRETRIAIKPIQTTNDKISRVHIVTPIIENKKVLLPFSASWLEMFIREFEEFPNGQFDDIVDSTVQFLNEAKKIYLETTKNAVLHLSQKTYRSRTKRRQK